MFLTTQVLKKHKGSKKEIEIFERFYPAGAEFAELLQNEDIDKDLLHWCNEHLSLSKVEREMYEKTCNIINSMPCWKSSNITNSQFVVSSEKIDLSQHVFNSFSVMGSTEVVKSEVVKNSRQVFNSSFIDTSSRIFSCSNVTNSDNIIDSNIIVQCSNIWKTFQCFKSSEIINSTNLENCYSCANCSSIAHCLFCEGISDVNYYVFNKPVAQWQYNLFVSQYKEFLSNSLEFIFYWPHQSLVVEYPKYNNRENWWIGISETFWKWVDTLPNFDMQVLYNITKLSRFSV